MNRSPLHLAAAAILAAVVCAAAADTDTITVTPPPGVTPTVFRVSLHDEAISPGTARFIIRAIDEAERAAAAAIVIELDTPGGLMQSTHAIVRRIVDSRVPVVVYIAPSGARGASAGVFITLSAHVAAMAPGTHIGAAHPVSVGGGGFPGGGDGGGDEEPAPPTPGGSDAPAPAADDAKPDAKRPAPSSVMEGKIVNDAVAWVRSLAEMRGRNADWAEKSVAESDSITATVALELNVVDLIAADISDLLAKIDGRSVTLAGGVTHKLATKDAAVHHVQMWWGEKLLAVISSPNVAFLLLMFGFYGVLFEFYSPGWGVGGTLGVILLLLGFFGLAYLPVDYAGLALIFLGLALFAAEAFVTSFGALTLGGVACVVLGGVMLIDSPAGWMRVSLGVVLPVAIATAAVTVFLVTQVVASMNRKSATGAESITGATARAKAAFAAAADPEDGWSGAVAFHGETWSARSASPVKAGQRVTVVDRHGLTLIVEPVLSMDAPADDT